jgi:imidazolonepropionase-like amidohydrolase
MLAIRAARLFDGEHAALVADPLVLVEGGRIVDIASGGAAPAGADEIDFGDVTLLPGLIDAHVHLVFDASPDPVGALAARSDDEALAAMRVAARRALAAGITTVRDLGDRGYLGVTLRDQLAATPGSGPCIVAAGPPITTVRGHCWYLGGEAEGTEGLRAAVRDRAAHGVDVVKVMASGGEMTPGTHSHEAQFGVTELAAAVDEAHRLGLPVTAHAHAAAGIAHAVAAGVDMIEHGSFMTVDSVAIDEEVLAALVASGITVSATTGMLPGRPPPPRIAVRLPGLFAVMARLRAEGVPFVASSDAGINPAKPHNVLPYAMEMMVERLDAAPVDALRAVTSTAAAACRIGDRAGRLAAGFDADILAVRGDPLRDIAVVHAVEAVFRAGVRVAQPA